MKSYICNTAYQIRLSNLDFQASLSLKNLCLYIQKISEWQPTSGFESTITTGSTLHSAYCIHAVL